MPRVATANPPRRKVLGGSFSKVLSGKFSGRAVLHSVRDPFDAPMPDVRIRETRLAQVAVYGGGGY
jgi:hypothetical protein